MSVLCWLIVCLCESCRISDPTHHSGRTGAAQQFPLNSKLHFIPNNASASDWRLQRAARPPILSSLDPAQLRFLAARRDDPHIVWVSSQWHRLCQINHTVLIHIFSNWNISCFRWIVCTKVYSVYTVCRSACLWSNFPPDSLKSLWEIQTNTPGTETSVSASLKEIIEKSNPTITTQKPTNWIHSANKRENLFQVFFIGFFSSS